MSQPKGYVDTPYLQTTAALLQPFKQRSYALMQLQTGQKVLDVGCGPGSDTLPLAHLVGPTGQVAGVDYDPAMIAEADQRARQAGVSAWVSHRQGETDALPFDADYFDACRSERVFQHLHHPEQALSEMVRVTRPGGRAVVLDADWGTLSIDTDEVNTERHLVRAVAERSLYNGYSGRQIYRLFKRQPLSGLVVEAGVLVLTDYRLARRVIGLDDIEQEATSAGIIAPEELHRWHASLEQAEQEGWFFASVTMILLGGEKASEVSLGPFGANI
jgi:SAM-dependent methyltransferase